MKKINFLTTVFNGMTGGAIYDEQFFKILKDRFKNSVNLYQDSTFENEHTEIVSNYIRYGVIYREHVEELLNCDYLFVNSRLYTRFIFLPGASLRNCKCKIFTIHHHFNYKTERGLKSLIHRYYELKYLKKMHGIITPNKYTYDELLKYRIRNTHHLLEAYIDNSIHDNNIEKENIVLFIGSVIARKGVDYAIKAFSRFHRMHKNYRLLIVGKYVENDPFYKKLLFIIKKFDLSDVVEFKGRVSDIEKMGLLERSKIFLFPSFNEGYGWVLVEAMSYGIPVVAFNNTAIPYTVNDRNGILVKNKSVKGLSSGLVLLADRSDYYHRLSEGAIETVRSLPSQEDVFYQYRDFMSAL